jgi:hypothetical protein
VGNREQIIQRLHDGLDDLYVFSHPPEHEDIVVNDFMPNPLVAIAPMESLVLASVTGSRNSCLDDRVDLERHGQSLERHTPTQNRILETQKGPAIIDNNVESGPMQNPVEYRSTMDKLDRLEYTINAQWRSRC